MLAPLKRKTQYTECTRGSFGCAGKRGGATKEGEETQARCKQAKERLMKRRSGVTVKSVALMKERWKKEEERETELRQARDYE